MARKLTAEFLSGQGLDQEQIDNLLQEQGRKAQPRTHTKHWVYMTDEQAAEVAELYKEDPSFRQVKYSEVRKARKAAKEA